MACQILAHSPIMSAAGYWQKLELAVIFIHPNNSKLAQWVTWVVSMQEALQKLICFRLPGIMHRSLQHGAVHYSAATLGDDSR